MIYKIVESFVTKLKSEEYRKILSTKKLGFEYENWVNNFSLLREGLTFYDDTIPGIASYAAVASLSRKYENLKLKDYIVVQKSCLNDFFTIFIKSKIIINIDNAEIEYPYVVLISDIGYYESIFNEVCSNFVKLYPSGIYTPYAVYKIEFDTFFKKDKTVYEILYGYDTNILDHKYLGDQYYKPK